MVGNSRSVSFTLKTSDVEQTQGILEIHGLLRYDDRVLVVEYQHTTWQRAGNKVATSPVETLRIPLRDVQDVEVKKGLWSRQVVLRPKSLGVLEGVPGAQGDRLALRIARKDWPEATRLASHVRLELSELRLEELDEDSDA